MTLADFSLDAQPVDRPDPSLLQLDRPRSASLSQLDQQSLLRKHAPILRFDQRELFMPTEVDGYVEACTLWDRDGLIDPQPNLARLDHRLSVGTNLRFVEDERRRRLVGLRVRTAARRLLTARLGRVGLLGRILDAVVRLSAWVRPTTPPGTTVAAAERAAELGLHRNHVCYARVAEAGEWLVLHYAYFYVMNDWRSSYSGLNDHEADWEQAWIYCDPKTLAPVWVVPSSHENGGEDLRRHWQDPEITIVDGHPVLYPSAGSHAMYFRPGDYISRIDIPALRWVLWLQRWLRPGSRPAPGTRGLGPALGVPFVDSASGDGTQVDAWDLRIMDENEGWVGSFRGLWGRDTRDPAQGERGPSGPKFDRDGEIRAAWADPLSIAGLHGTPPPSAAAAQINLQKLERTMATLDEEIRHCGQLLPLARQTASVDNMTAESKRLTALLRQRCELEGLRNRLLKGHEPVAGVRDHLRNPAVPLPAASHDRWSTGGWVTATWAAFSVPLLLFALAAVILFGSVGKLALIPVGLLGAVSMDFLVQRRFMAAFRMVVAQATGVAVAVNLAGDLASIGRYLLIGALGLGAFLLVAANTSELLAIRSYRARSRHELDIGSLSSATQAKEKTRSLSR